MSTAFAAGDANTGSHPKNTLSGLSSHIAFPQFPGENVHAHAATQYKEAAEARFAARNLLVVANGGTPAAARAIVDVDLRELPELPVDNRDYSRRLETRIKIKATNAANAQKRLQITLEAWTEIYTLLKVSTEATAPVLSRDLKLNCDLALVSEHVGSFDGPRAWRLTLHYLEQGQKNEGEKDFYRTAERIQRASHLPDGCQAYIFVIFLQNIFCKI